MTTITQHAIFSREVERKVDELIAWIISNSPDQKAALSKTEFSDVRRRICNIASGTNPSADHEPEPEAGGPQYINDNPAPWP